MAIPEDRTLLLEAENGDVNENGDVFYPEIDADGQTSEPADMDGSAPHRRLDRRPHIRGTGDLVVAIFVVAFDTRKGNVVEWHYPEETNLEGVEFCAMASGFHNVQDDFIYFKHNQLFGLSYYERISVDNSEERGARMRSLGILSSSYSNLHTHMKFLKEQTKLRLEAPDSPYEPLIQYFWNIQAPREQPRTSNSLATVDLPHMEITHPAGCFTQFLNFFGPHVFVLWRLALLKKRILLFSPPPVGVVCYRVYCTCLLASHNIDNLMLHTDSYPMFFVNVADIDTLSQLNNYIACTTESIFKNKPNLYDVYVNGQNITSTSLKLDPYLRVTPADEIRHQKLVGSRNMALTLRRSISESSDDDVTFARFFQILNTELFQMLQKVSQSDDHILTVEMIDTLGLDSTKDHMFLTELAALHGLNVAVQRHSDVFSCCI